MKKTKNIYSKFIFINKNHGGMILPMVLAFLALMVMSVIPLSSMIQQDTRLIERVQQKKQAQFMAEAGINHAFAKLSANGFAARANFSGSLDTGTYSVTFFQSGTRHLINSTGTVPGATETVSVEIVDNTTPIALNFFIGAENDVNISSIGAVTDITGDIHANNDVSLRSQPGAGSLNVTGTVSAVGIVKEGQKYNQGSGDAWDDAVFINGASDDTATVLEGVPRVTFPALNDLKANYKQAAIAGGDYYNGNQTFTAANLSPACGVIYIDGNVTFKGVNYLNGGIIADSINVEGALCQSKSGGKNVVMAVNGDISVLGMGVNVTKLYLWHLATLKCDAFVYASQDIKSLGALTTVLFNGIMLAGRDVLIDTKIIYGSKMTVDTSILPAELSSSSGFSLISWNE